MRRGVAIPTGSARVGLPALLALLAVAGCGGDIDTLEAARRAMRDSDEARAVGLYQQYLEGHPDDYEALKEYTLTLGERWAYAGGDRAPIIENLDKLYEMRPADQGVQGLLSVMLVREGQVAAESGRFEEAAAVYRRAIAVNPESGAAQYHLGVLHAERGEAEQAFAQYRAAAAKRPQIPDLYLRLGRAYLDLDDPDRAITTLGLVLELAGVSTYLVPQAQCGLAQAYAAKGMEEESDQALDNAGADCSVQERSDSEPGSTATPRYPAISDRVAASTYMNTISARSSNATRSTMSIASQGQ